MNQLQVLESQMLLFILALLNVHMAAPYSFPDISREHTLIGWQGETHHTLKDRSFAEAGGIARLDPKSIQQLSWKPRAFLAKNLLTDEQCDYLVNSVKNRLERSGVVDMETGGGLESNIRTSQGAFLNLGADAVVRDIERRIADFSMIPAENGEGLQVLRYDVGQEYQQHFDYFFHAGGQDNGGNRLATVLLYLNTVEDGGETAFPDAKDFGEQAFTGMSPCGLKGLGVRPRKGDALLFFSLKPTGELDRHSLHAGCPVLRGTKWTATKWLHVGKFSMLGDNKIQHVVHVPPKPPMTPGCK
eukprot:gene5919-7121_t